MCKGVFYRTTVVLCAGAPAPVTGSPHMALLLQDAEILLISFSNDVSDNKMLSSDNF